MKLILSIILGYILAIIASKMLFVGSFLTLLPWGLVGLATGIYAKSNKEAIINGAAYGFVLSFIFMASGYTGTQPLATRLPFFVILGLFGALCGIFLGFTGHFIKRVRKHTSP